MPRFLAGAARRVRRGLAGGDWARMSAVVRSGTGSGRDSLFIGTESSFINTVGPQRGHSASLTLFAARDTFPCLPRCRSRADNSCGGVAQLGERVNGIHEVRGSIPLASTCPLRSSTTLHWVVAPRLVGH